MDQSGSVHVSKVDDIAALKRAYHHMSQETWTEMDKGVGSDALIECYIPGREYSVEGYVSSDTLVIVSITEKITTPPPFFVELQHCVPASLLSSEEKKITSYMAEVVNALDFNLGVFHAEIKVNSEGVFLIEMAGRLAGDKITDLIGISTKINMQEIMIQAHLGLSLPLQEKVTYCAAGITYFVIDQRRYQSVSGMALLSQMPGFVDAELFYNPGDSIPALTSFMGRVGYVMFTAPNSDLLKKRLADAVKAVRFDS